MNGKNIRSSLIFITLAFMLALVIYPDRYISSIARGLDLFVKAVLPALFPFFFFSRILTLLNAFSPFEKYLKKPLKKLFNAPPISGYILFVSLMSGYPLGAKLLADCYNDGYIDEEDAKNISIFTSTSGPLFVLGSVGINMMANKTAGFVMLISHYAGAILNGIIMVNRKQKSALINKTALLPQTDGDLLGKSILSSVTAIAIVGGYIAVFVMLADILADFKILPFFERFFHLFGMPRKISSGTTLCAIEITAGCKALCSSGYPVKTVLPVCAAMISFGGASIILQSLAFISQCKIKPLFFLKNKITQGIITYFIATLLCLVLF